VTIEQHVTFFLCNWRGSKPIQEFIQKIKKGFRVQQFKKQRKTKRREKQEERLQQILDP